MYTTSENPPEKETPAVEILLGVSSSSRSVRRTTLLASYVLRQKFFAASITNGRPADTAWNNNKIFCMFIFHFYDLSLRIEIAI